MLNIKTRISLSRDSKKRIKNFLKKRGGVLNGDSWSLVSKNVKNDISGKLLYNQSFKCTYCERYLIALTHQIDHFAHKAAYPQFTFSTTNLFYSCGFCNSSGIKGQKSTIHVLNHRYDLTTFNIVHPYYDNPDNEMVFRDADRIFFDFMSCTAKGLATIIFFSYDQLPMTTIRSRDLMYQRLNPLLINEERRLIQEAIAYK